MPRQHAIARRVFVALLAISAVVPATAAQGQAGGQECPTVGAYTVTGEVTNPALTETSGIAASRTQPGIFWIHNDSGNSNDLYAINEDGDILMQVGLANIDNFDFEDIAVGPGPDADSDYIYVADVGNNLFVREVVYIYRIKEPKVTSGILNLPLSAIERFDFSHQNPSGGIWNRNGEALAVDPVLGDLVLIEKHLETVDGIPNSSWVYRIRQSELVEGEVILAKPIVAIRGRYNSGTIPPTAAEFSADGKVLVAKNHNEMFTWSRDADQSIFDAMAEHRETDCLYQGSGGEAITVATDGSAFYSIPEGSTPDITRIEASLPDPGTTCKGVMVNIKGTGGDDTLIGTSQRDVTHGRAGNDTIKARGGSDLICGGSGNDLIIAKGGGDRVYAGSGADEIRGGDGVDLLRGDLGPDRLFGQNGDDELFGNSGVDELWGGAGFDTLNGGPADDICRIGAGGGTKKKC